MKARRREALRQGGVLQEVPDGLRSGPAVCGARSVFPFRVVSHITGTCSCTSFRSLGLSPGAHGVAAPSTTLRTWSMSDHRSASAERYSPLKGTRRRSTARAGTTDEAFGLSVGAFRHSGTSPRAPSPHRLGRSGSAGSDLEQQPHLGCLLMRGSVLVSQSTGASVCRPGCGVAHEQQRGYRLALRCLGPFLCGSAGSALRCQVPPSLSLARFTK